MRNALLIVAWISYLVIDFISMVYTGFAGIICAIFIASLTVLLVKTSWNSLVKGVCFAILFCTYAALPLILFNAFPEPPSGLETITPADAFMSGARTLLPLMIFRAVVYLVLTVAAANLALRKTPTATP